MTKPHLPWNPTKDPLVFWKEVLPVGEIVKWIGDNKEEQRVGITEQFIDKKIRQFAKMRRVGVRVPLFKTHVEDPDNERGIILKAAKRLNRRGKKSLFLRVKFHDLAAARRGTRVDVSAGMPPKFVDGKGNAYDYPIRHLALTSKPVVPGLDPWSDGSAGLVLSFNTPSGLLLSGDNKMKKSKSSQFSALMAALGVKSKGSQAQQIAAAIKSAKKLRQDLEFSEDEDEDEDDELDDEEDFEFSDDELDDEFEDDELEAPTRKRRKTGAISLSESPVLVEQMRKMRIAQIKMLMSGDDALINPAYAKKLAKRYATPEAIKFDLNLSHGDGETEFDRVIATIEEVAGSQPLARTGRHATSELKLRKRPVVELSHDEDEGAGENALIRNARAMAKRHAAKQQRA